jgi:hypothetical protein
MHKNKVCKSCWTLEKEICTTESNCIANADSKIVWATQRQISSSKKLWKCSILNLISKCRANITWCTYAASLEKDMLHESSSRPTTILCESTASYVEDMSCCLSMQIHGAQKQNHCRISNVRHVVWISSRAPTIPRFLVVFLRLRLLSAIPFPVIRYL